VNLKFEGLNRPCPSRLIPVTVWSDDGQPRFSSIRELLDFLPKLFRHSILGCEFEICRTKSTMPSRQIPLPTMSDDGQPRFSSIRELIVSLNNIGRYILKFRFFQCRIRANFLRYSEQENRTYWIINSEKIYSTNPNPFSNPTCNPTHCNSSSSGLLFVGKRFYINVFT
jgi:hypothetical protein